MNATNLTPEQQQTLQQYAELLVNVWRQVPPTKARQVEVWLQQHGIPTPVDLDRFAEQIRKAL